MAQKESKKAIYELDHEIRALVERLRKEPIDYYRIGWTHGSMGWDQESRHWNKNQRRDYQAGRMDYLSYMDLLASDKSMT